MQVFFSRSKVATLTYSYERRIDVGNLDPELEQVQKCVGVKKVKVFILNIFTK